MTTIKTFNSNIAVRIAEDHDQRRWDQYVKYHQGSTLYHLFDWNRVIANSYGHRCYYLMAVKDGVHVKGILPLVYISHFLFKNSLTSIPFFDISGILADNMEIEKKLLMAAHNISHHIGAKEISLRHGAPLAWLSIENLSYQELRHKTRMIIDLPNSSDTLMNSFKSKLRSQIKKPIKLGLVAKIGGLELLDDFYSVFLQNMRDLGSPVHSKTIIINVVKTFMNMSNIIVIYKDCIPLAASVVIRFKSILMNPWASSLKNYSRLNPNMLLYWKMLEYACDHHLNHFDFGRSTPGEGTYKFKKQWGAEEHPLYWYDIFLDDQISNQVEKDEKSKFSKAIAYWQKIPVPITKIIGPLIRKYITL